MTKPTAIWTSHQYGDVLTVRGHGYTAAATFDGLDNRGAGKFKARLDAEGYAPQWSYFALSPMDAPDDENAVAECLLALFSIGRGDVDPEFFAPDPRASHDERWVKEWNADRDNLECDREVFDRRKQRAKSHADRRTEEGGGGETNVSDRFQHR